MLEFIKSIFKHKLTQCNIESMRAMIIGEEITVTDYSPTDPITIKEIIGLKKINKYTFVEITGETRSGKGVSMVLSEKAFRKLYNTVSKNKLDDSNDIYIKEV